MEKIWLDAYPPGVPAEIDSGEYRNISALIERSFSRFHANPAFACDGKQITYGELDVMSGALAA
jgi:long-chain acyl-CoA synthetase